MSAESNFRPKAVFVFSVRSRWHPSDQPDQVDLQVVGFTSDRVRAFRKGQPFDAGQGAHAIAWAALMPLTVAPIQRLNVNGTRLETCRQDKRLICAGRILRGVRNALAWIAKATEVRAPKAEPEVENKPQGELTNVMLRGAWRRNEPAIFPGAATHVAQPGVSHAFYRGT